MISKSADEPFKIAIVGGGIGGLSCALFAHHHCKNASVNIKIDVYEQASQYKEIGAGVGLGINAARLIHKIGIGDKLNDIAGHRTGVWISFRRYDNSEEVVTIPVNDTQKVRQAPAARTDLLDLVRESVAERDAATLHVKKACQRVEVRGSILHRLLTSY
jgi:salicylate hydroxylase